jgi:MutS domain V
MYHKHISTLLAVFLPAWLFPARRLLREFRANWGKPGSGEQWLVSRYFDLTKGKSAAGTVDDRTWNDLEFPKLFQVMNSTVTPVGGQSLYKRLRIYIADKSTLAQLYRGYETLRAEASQRESIQLKLAGLSADTSAGIADYVFGAGLHRPRYAHLILLQSLLAAGAIGAVLLSVLPLWVLLVVLLANAIVTFRFSPRVHRDAEGLYACYKLLHVADALARSGPPGSSIRQIRELIAETANRRQARRALRLIGRTHGSAAYGMIAAWLNLLFMSDLLAYLFTVGRLARIRPVMASTFDLIGSLDADVAIASFLELHPDHCQPGMSGNALIDLEQAWHPLVAAPVKVSMRLEGRSALITGSNMAGKTTLIKTVGINIIMGRTLGICLAARASLPRSGAMASIRGEHSVESGKSHYFAEIEAIKVFFNAARTGECAVFLIDELLSGTNTVERLAAARAVLEVLSEDAQVLVTTHDVELQNSLAGRFDLYHFMENPDIEGFFDYQLRVGATVERNAIRLLGRMGFPEEVVGKALEYSAPGRPR